MNHGVILSISRALFPWLSTIWFAYLSFQVGAIKDWVFSPSCILRHVLVCLQLPFYVFLSLLSLSLIHMHAGKHRGKKHIQYSTAQLLRRSPHFLVLTKRTNANQSNNTLLTHCFMFSIDVLQLDLAFRSKYTVWFKVKPKRISCFWSEMKRHTGGTHSSEW